MVTKEGARDTIEQVALGNMERLGEVLDNGHDDEDIRKCAMTMVVATMFLYRSAPDMWSEILDIGAAGESAIEALRLADMANAELKETTLG